MHDERELNIDELSAVIGGATSTGGGFHPTPPWEDWIGKLINSLLHPPRPK